MNDSDTKKILSILESRQEGWEKMTILISKIPQIEDSIIAHGQRIESLEHDIIRHKAEKTVYQGLKDWIIGIGGVLVGYFSLK